MNFFKKFNKLKNDYKDNNISVVSLLVCLFGVLALVFGTSYAYLSYTAYAEEENYISAGTLLLNFSDDSDAIYMSNAIPQLDQQALESNPEYSFTVKNNGSLNAKYEVRLINVCNEGIAITSGDVTVTPDVCIPLEYIKVGVKQGESEYAVASLTNDGKFYIGNGTLDANASSIEYKIKIWLDERTPDDYQSELNGVTRTVTFVGQLEIYGEQMPTDTYAVGAISLADAIKAQGVVSSGNGLYVSTETNDGSPTYYYKGAVENNYVEFANIGTGEGQCVIKDEYVEELGAKVVEGDREQCLGEWGDVLCKYDDLLSLEQGMSCDMSGGTIISSSWYSWEETPELWRIVRINEDGTIRLALNSSVDLAGEYSYGYAFSYSTTYEGMYYSNSYVKEDLQSWYNYNLSSYDSYIATGKYCEQAKVTNSNTYATAGNVTLTLKNTYDSSFTCTEDANGYGQLDLKVGLLTYDEITFAGTNSYFPTTNSFLTMSPAGYGHDTSNDNYEPITVAGVWTCSNVLTGSPVYIPGWTSGKYYVVPVINLKADVTVTGLGTSGDPWVVQTN